MSAWRKSLESLPFVTPLRWVAEDPIVGTNHQFFGLEILCGKRKYQGPSITVIMNKLRSRRARSASHHSALGPFATEDPNDPMLYQGPCGVTVRLTVFVTPP